jgi:hypothetical protein
MEGSNEGMQVRDSGTVNVTGSLSVGPDSRAISRITLDRLAREGNDDIAARLLELEAVVTVHEHQLHNLPELLDAITQLSGELAKKPPNKVVLKGILNEISASVQSVAQVATAVESLQRVLQRIF